MGEAKNKEEELESADEIDQEISQEIDGNDQSQKEQVSEKKEKKVEKVEEEKITYTPPPDYEKLGRGLVYNCDLKHWACVNRVGYFQCQKIKK